MTTMHGNRSTTPSGTDIVELPLNLKGRRKNASRDANLPFDFSASTGTMVGETF